MKDLKYITNEKGKKIEVIIPIQKYEELIEIKNMYEDRLRILNSIKSGAEEILQDRTDNHLNQELSEFINEIEDYSH